MAAEAGKGGARPRHVPQRTCVNCRRTDAKRGLVRLVRDSAGRVAVDLGGKQSGRGAYLCRDRACWEAAIRRRGVERALKLDQLHPDDRSALIAFAQQLAAPAGVADSPRTSAPE